MHEKHEFMDQTLSISIFELPIILSVLQPFFCFSFAVESPGLSGGPGDIGYMDYGKTLTFKAKVENYEMQEISTILNIQCE